MSHFLTNDDEYRDLIYGDDCRPYLMARSRSADGYKFARMQEKRFRVRARGALGRANGYFRNMIEAIADAKLRRTEREVELRGICFDRSNASCAARESHQTER